MNFKWRAKMSEEINVTDADNLKAYFEKLTEQLTVCQQFILAQQREIVSIKTRVMCLEERQ